MSLNTEDQFGVGDQPRELIIGESFRKSPGVDGDGDTFHSLRYDFKPASVDVTKMARMEWNNDKVKVTVPNVVASNQTETIFTGNKKPHLKECVLIIDHETGGITLERLTYGINVKKTRVEGSSRPQQPRPSTSSCTPGQTPSDTSSLPSNGKPSSSLSVTNAVSFLSEESSSDDSSSSGSSDGEEEQIRKVEEDLKLL